MVIIWVKHAPKEYANAKGPEDKPLFDPECLPIEPVGSDEEHTYKIYKRVVACVLNSIFCSQPSSSARERRKVVSIRIVSSPFARARKTAQYLKIFLEENIQKRREDIKVTIEPVNVKLGEYLGNQSKLFGGCPLTKRDFYSEKFFYKSTILSIRDKKVRSCFPFINETSISHLERRCREFIKEEQIFKRLLLSSSGEEDDKKEEEEHWIYVSHGIVIQKMIECLVNESLYSDDDWFTPKVPLFYYRIFKTPLDPLSGFILSNENSLERF